ncbi:sensor histidine kinase KdpD [Sphingosinicella sp. CPCC 101087]|uniref:sensor histidine kinase n=1 Tax=Sphingosinicella sp. CPCC 101087 TaxID=2497754 RepID=UPI00198016E6|nr:HAMP domain-containing sensor histidine kinase [Sphingosinicella sp. CPCC 101087]
MKAPPSIFRRLILGFVATAIIGSAGLVLLELTQLDIAYGRPQEIFGREAGLVHEIIEHGLLPVVALLVPMLVAAVWVVRTSLAPLDIAGSRIAAASDEDRGFQIDSSDLPREAIPFVKAVNDLLVRLDAAAARQEAFAADVAHELRTPLSILALELDRMKGADAQRLRKDVLAMSRLVEQLLLIAQLDAADAGPIRFGPTRLDLVAEEVVMRMAPIASAQGRAAELQVLARPTVHGLPEVLQAAIRNLFENALRVTPANKTVSIIVGPGAQIRVRDKGPGLSESQLEALSQRFARADRRHRGTGLGLAIVSKVMALHGGSLETAMHRREIIMRFPDEGGDRAR